MFESGKFSSAEINFIVHATEDETKLLHAIKEVLAITTISFSPTYFEGHFGNKILLLSAALTAEGALTLSSKIFSSLNNIDRNQLSNYLQEYADENGNLYIRLDKQKIVRHNLALGGSDPLRIKFRAVRLFKPYQNLQNYRGGLPSAE